MRARKTTRTKWRVMKEGANGSMKYDDDSE